MDSEIARKNMAMYLEYYSREDFSPERDRYFANAARWASIYLALVEMAKQDAEKENGTM